MKLHAERSAEGSRMVLVSDEGEELTWPLFSHWTRNLDLKKPEGSKINIAERSFWELNRYWARLSEIRRKQIFEVYEEMNTILGNIISPSDMQSSLTDRFKRLYELHPENELRKFLSQQNLPYPETVLQVREDMYSQSKTYGPAKYRDLLVLVLGLRVASPIFGNYIDVVEKITTKNYQEIMAMRLLEKTWPVDHVGFQDLVTYIEASREKEDKNNLGRVLEGISTTNVTDQIISKLCVRHLSIRPIMANETEPNNLTWRINSTVTGEIDNRKGNKNTYTNKKPRANTPDENKSTLEEYKIKQKLSEGDQSGIEYFIEQPELMARKIDDTIPEGMATARWEIDQEAVDFDLTDGQMRIAQLICAPAVPARAIPALERIYKHRVFSVVRAILLHWGYPHLAAFMIAETYDGDDSAIRRSENRSRFPRDLSQQLQELYPHNPDPNKSEKKPNVNSKQPKRSNVALENISVTVDHLQSSDWIVYGEESLLDAIKEDTVEGIYITPGDIQEIFSRLVLDVATRNQ